MAKGKTKTGVPNKHLHARISYLQQAATYLSIRGHEPDGSDSQKPSNDVPAGPQQVDISCEKSTQVATHPTATETSDLTTQKVHADPTFTASGQAHYNSPSSGGLPNHLTAHLRQVAQKSTIRLHPNIKHALCRTCSAVLIEGQTCRKYVENLSRGGRKPHADVLVLECVACGAKKRFPIGARKQARKGLREQQRQHEEVVGQVDLLNQASEDVAGHQKEADSINAC